MRTQAASPTTATADAVNYPFALDPLDMTPSSLWARAAGLLPAGPRWSREATCCVMCGAAVGPNDHGVVANGDLFDEGFNAKLDCRHPGKAVCGNCQVLWTKQWLQTDSKSYAVAGEGVFKLAKADDIARFVLLPPTSPYVAVFNTRQQAHIIWRTPVALPSMEYLQVRIDDEIMTIDRLRVLRAVHAWQTSLSILKAVGRPKAQPFNHSYDLASPLVGRPNAVAVRAVRAHSAKGGAAIKALESLTAADWWALCSVRDRDLGVLVAADGVTPHDDLLPARRRCGGDADDDGTEESEAAPDDSVALSVDA